MDLSTFYYPECGNNLILNETEIESDSSQDSSSNDESDPDASNSIILFIGTQADDISYEMLLEQLNCDIELEAYSPQAVLESQSNLERVVARKWSPMFRIRQELVDTSTKAEVVMNWLYKKMSLNREAYRIGLTTQQISNIIYEFTSLKRITKKARKSMNMKREKFKKRHLKSLEKFIKDHHHRSFTLSDARNHLIQEFPNLGSASQSAISKLLHEKLNMSYKKLGSENPSKMIRDNKANLISWTKTLISLLKEDFYLVYIDEFTVNRNTTNTYGWSSKGISGRLLIRTPDFKMSFIVAHSQHGLEGLIGTKTTFNQEKYINFLQKLVSHIKTKEDIYPAKIILVADNWRFHRTELIRKFIKKEKIKWLFILPYSPEINSCEKLINFIKSNVKKEVNSNR